MSSPAITAVVFDLDDTLYPEREYAFSGFDAVASAFEDHLGDRAETAALMRELFDTEHRPRVFNTLLARLRNRAAGLSPRGVTFEESARAKARGSHFADDEALVKRMIQTYRGHTPTISLHADANAALSRFRDTHKLGLITDGPAQTQAAKIDALSLRQRFDAIILTDELGPSLGKPHPHAFELIAGQLGVSPAQCAYIADNLAKDFVAPNALGWTTIQIRRTDGIYRDNPPADGGIANQVIDTLDDLDDLLVSPPG